MLIFIDDSGDPGFKVEKGSSEVFVIALIIFGDFLDGEETALKIKRLRQSMMLKDNFEFRFNKCRKEFRCKFLSTVADSRFRVRAMVMQKDRIYGRELRRSKESFYSYAIKMVLKHHGGTIRDAKIRLDGHGDRQFRNTISLYLRRELNSPQNKIFKDLKFVDSQKNVLIQLADMVAGAINRSYSNKDDRNTYKGIILHKIEDEWKFGR